MLQGGSHYKTHSNAAGIRITDQNRPLHDLTVKAVDHWFHYAISIGAEKNTAKTLSTSAKRLVCIAVYADRRKALRAMDSKTFVAVCERWEELAMAPNCQRWIKAAWKPGDRFGQLSVVNIGVRRFDSNLPIASVNAELNTLVCY